MSTVDDRIVSMKFDNASFERKMEETLRSLDKLRQNLDFTGSTKRLGELDSAGKSFSLGGMGATVEGVSTKFLALATIGITALSRLTDAAITSGTRIVKAFSLDPVLQGFEEYETNMNSIQTILANTKSKGSTLEDVNNALDELNTYADQTIYNFSEMTRNIGTFTAAGVELDTATQSIKGIANLAAISGSNSQQASTAMYQLSQALATGTLKLMDWNSVVNAGMGGEVFQSALFETGKAMGTLNDVPMDQTFEEWKDAGNSFRDTLQDGWITGEVLTGTLQSFTGDLTDAQLQSLGYNAEQIAQMKELGALGKAAATEVKTVTQLVDTVKEAIGSGWSSTFRIMIGDFEEAKALFTDISNTIGNIVGKSADARNALLTEFKELGGRDNIIKGFSDGFAALGTVLGTVKEAFREIFPPKSAKELAHISEVFAKLAETLKNGIREILPQVKTIFKGLFATLGIGWEIVKELAWLFGSLFKSLFESTSGGTLDFFTDLASVMIQVHEALVINKGIHKFFYKLQEAIRAPIKFMQDFVSNVAEMFGALTGDDLGGEVLGNIESRFGALGRGIERVGDAVSWISDRLRGVFDFFAELWSYISTWFSELGSKIAEVMTPDDFDNALDILNVGLLGGIAALLTKFVKDGINLDFGDGFIENLTDVLDELTTTLKTMQLDLRAKALLKIAAAVGILAGSVLILSTVDSAALSKALTAMAVGFGQLVGAMFVMEKASLGTGAIKLGILAGGMVLLATAIGVLSISIKSLSKLDMDELGKGLIGVAGAMGVMITAMNFVPSNTGGLIRAGFAMIGMSVALIILSKAVKEFAEMDWGEMAKGLVGVAAGLGIMTTAMNFMPKGMLLSSIGLAAMAASMIILAEAVEAFAAIPWKDMGKGLLGIGAGLLVVAVGMNFMPITLPITAVGLGLVAGALLIMSQAIQSMGGIDFGTLAKGIGAIAVTLGILALAANAMTGTIVGAGAIVIMSGALLILTKVLQELGKLSIAQIATGLATIAIALGILGLAAALLTPVIPALYALGGALVLLGAAFALFGVGAALVAKAFEIMAKAGKKGFEVLIDVIELLITSIPRLLGSFLDSIVELAAKIIQVIPTILKAVTVLLSHILDTVKELAPKFVDTVVEFIMTIIKAIDKNLPELIEAGANILISILKGIRDNIYEIAVLGAEILTNFALGLQENIDILIEAGLELLFKFLETIADRASDIVEAGVDLLVSFLDGIVDNLSKVVDAVGDIITEFIDAVGDNINDIVTAGVDILINFLLGVSENISRIAETVGEVITQFIEDVGALTDDIIEAGFDLLLDFLSGIIENVEEVVTAVSEIIVKFITSVGNAASDIAKAGADTIISFIQGIGGNLGRMITAGVDTVLAFIQGLGANALRLAEGAADVLISFLNGLAIAIEQKAPELRAAGWRIATAILDGMSLGLISGQKRVVATGGELGTTAIASIAKAIQSNSPSKKAIALGKNVIEGLIIGLNETTKVERQGDRVGSGLVNSIQNSIEAATSSLESSADFNPVITPVLDLSNVTSGAKSIGSAFRDTVLSPAESISQARIISADTQQDLSKDTRDSSPISQQITFEQNNYSPKELSTNDIYRNTKSQIALAREELSV